MLEITHAFSNNCLQTGKERTMLLEKVLAAAIAYTTPCMAGDMSEMSGHYRTLCKENASRVISSVNEVILINTHNVLENVKKLWCGRYEMINSPIECKAIEEFHASLKQVGCDLDTPYQYWIPKFQMAVNSFIVAHNGKV